MFSFRRREKTPNKVPNQQPKVEPKMPECFLTEHLIVKMLNIEEKIANQSFTTKNIEDLVQCYAVNYFLTSENR